MEAKGKTIGVIGLGLIGGSAALRLKQAGYATKVVGYDYSEAHVTEALVLKLIDEGVSIDDMLAKASVILIAIPVDATKKILPILLSKCTKKQVLLDMGSTKSAISTAVINHVNRANYVACHPIAGTENNGPRAALSTLFDNKVNIICDQELSSKKATKEALEITSLLGMRPKFMASIAHDKHIAYVSHLSHISSFTLGQTVLEVEKDENNIFDMAGSGFASTVRLAKSSPDMWAPIFIENSKNILSVLTAYIKNLENYKTMIEQSNETALKILMAKTNSIREVLDRDSITV